MKLASMFLAVVAVPSLASRANAAKLVALAVNSGTTSPPVAGSNVPVAPAGAKGFLIGTDNTADPLSPLSIHDLTFSGPGLVQRLAPNAAAEESIPSPNVQLRSEALSANRSDGPGAPATFGANDSWWWNQAQNGLTLSPVATGVQGGLPGGPMTMTGHFNLVGNVPAGIWRTAYIVATGDVEISGTILSEVTFDPNGNPSPNGGTARLDFASGQIVPEPSTLALAAMAGLCGLAIAFRRYRHRVASH